MNDDGKGAAPTSAVLYDLLEHHLPQLARVGKIMLGKDSDHDTQTELWLEAVVDDAGAASFVAQGSTQLFASLVILLAARQKTSASGMTDDRLEHGIEAAATSAGVLPADIRKLLLPASLSFKRR